MWKYERTYGQSEGNIAQYEGLQVQIKPQFSQYSPTKQRVKHN